MARVQKHYIRLDAIKAATSTRTSRPPSNLALRYGEVNSAYPDSGRKFPLNSVE